jgi:hypothetical protein
VNCLAEFANFHCQWWPMRPFKFHLASTFATLNGFQVWLERKFSFGNESRVGWSPWLFLIPHFIFFKKLFCWARTDAWSSKFKWGKKRACACQNKWKCRYSFLKTRLEFKILKSKLCKIAKLNVVKET